MFVGLRQERSGEPHLLSLHVARHRWVFPPHVNHSLISMICSKKRLDLNEVATFKISDGLIPNRVTYEN